MHKETSQEKEGAISLPGLGLENDMIDLLNETGI